MAVRPRYSWRTASAWRRLRHQSPSRKSSPGTSPDEAFDARWGLASPDELHAARVLGRGDEDDASPAVGMRRLSHHLELGLGGLDRGGQRDDGPGGHAVLFEHDAGLTLVVEAPGAQRDQIADPIRRELVGENDRGREPVAIEPGPRFLAAGRAAGHHHDGVGLGQRVLHDQGLPDPPKGGTVGHEGERGHGERGDDEPARARLHRSSSTRYSLILRESGASGLRARYLRKASLALSLCRL